MVLSYFLSCNFFQTISAVFFKKERIDLFMVQIILVNYGNFTVLRPSRLFFIAWGSALTSFSNSEK